jgi:ribose transport system permease protein
MTTNEAAQAPGAQGAAGAAGAQGAAGPAGAAGAQAAPAKNANRLGDALKPALPFAGLASLFLFFLLVTKGGILSASNLSNLVEQCFTVTLAAVGATFVYACGSFDISIGNVMALGELIIAYCMISFDLPIPVLILVGVAVTSACTLVTGFITAFLKVPAFVSSLCMMYICMGIVQAAVSKSDIYIPYLEYTFLNSAAIKGGALVALIAAGLVVFNKTRLGRDLKALGGSELAARESGVNKRRAMLLGFLCLGVCLGIAGFFSVVRVGVLTGTTGSGLGLNILVAIVLGGFPLTGGANARMSGAIAGALIVTLLSNGLQLMGVDSTVALFFKGMLFLAIVAISYERSKGKALS